METIVLQRKWDLTALEVENLRARFSGHFEHRVFRNIEHRGRLGARRNERAQLTDWVRDYNIVTNEGLDSFLDVHLSAATQITAWKVTMFTADVTPIATHTYAVPGITEIALADVAEAVRQAWTEAGVSAQSIDNSASPASYTADQAFTAWGAMIVGGGSGAATLGDTAGGGTYQCGAKFATQKSLSTSDSIDVTYTNTMADDAV